MAKLIVPAQALLDFKTSLLALFTVWESPPPAKEDVADQLATAISNFIEDCEDNT